MRQATSGRLGYIAAGLLLGGLASAAVAGAQELSEQGKAQISAILADKASRTPTERKMMTALLAAHRESRGVAMVQGLGPLRRVADRAHVDRRGMVVVDIKGRVTDELLATIARIGGAVLTSHPAFEAVRAQVPIRSVDAIAALPEVRVVGPAAEAIVNIGTITSQGDLAHAAASMRSTYSVNGTGVKIGVLSDSVPSLAARQATGDLPPTCGAPPCVTVLPGQAGPATGDEGTAMMEIVYDLAPGAQLFFATALPSPAQFAANIRALRNTYGCDIIVDDVTYYDEGAFQDGPVAQAVNEVTASGALYFSSAGNSGRLDAGTSGTWEGDFVNSGQAISVLTTGYGAALPIHSFNGVTGGGAIYYDTITGTTGSAISLKWSDPLGAATDDYDVFILDSTLSTIFDYSADNQNDIPGPPLIPGTHEPLEIMGPGFVNERIVVVLSSGAARALRIDTNRGRLQLATAGATYGHNGGQNTITVAAASIASASGGAFVGGTTNPVETYSSDGPRRIFFNPDGSAITPGNFLFGTGGGRTLQKPDITAADCVTTTTPGFAPFCGTSAAAPHAAAIAALLKVLPNKPSNGQVITAMSNTALDVTTNGVGRDRDSGVGIVMADRAAAALTTVPALNFFTLAPCRLFDTRVVSGPTGGAPLTCGGDVDFTVIGGTCGVPSNAKAISVNVTATEPSNQGNVRLFASGAPAPLVSTLNYAAAQTRANNAVAPLNSAGKIAVRCAPSGTAHVILDVNGYFQ